MAEEIRRTEQLDTRKKCFVIMPFSDPEGYEPGHFRKIYDYIFKPAIEAAGYMAERIDEDSVSNLIHSKMLNELVNAPIVLCDLTTNNPNVLYELGIRHAYDRPVVLVQECGQKRIFDIGAITSIEYHPGMLYEEILEDQKKIAEAIRQTVKAKNKYSIMDLVAMQPAQPAKSGSLSREDRLEILLQDVSRRIGTLENAVHDKSRADAEKKLADLVTAAGDDGHVYIFYNKDKADGDYEVSVPYFKSGKKLSRNLPAQNSQKIDTGNADSSQPDGSTE